MTTDIAPAAVDRSKGRPAVYAYQILTPHVRREDLDPASGILDNTANERPDWFEYWPIRRFLVETSLEEDAYYGFLSPRFKEKTNLRVGAAIEFIQSRQNRPDVVLFSPSLHLTAYHWNVFQYGEACHPGLLQLATTFFERIGHSTDLTAMVSHSMNEVYSNYFFAKPRFWRAWLAALEKLIEIAESKSDDLGKQFRQQTTYRGRLDAQIKVFIMERIPTWILIQNPTFSVSAREPFAVRSRLYKLPGAIVCDALKVAYACNGHHAFYQDLFSAASQIKRPVNWLIRFGGILHVPGMNDLLSRLGQPWIRASRL